MAMLEALPQQTLTTRTPWYAQARRFTGPLLRDVLSAAGAHGATLRLIALNDYQVDMPNDDAQRHDVLVARLLDGQALTCLLTRSGFEDKFHVKNWVTGNINAALLQLLVTCANK